MSLFKRCNYIVYVLAFVFILYSVHPARIYAQTSSGVALSVSILNKNAKDGSIIYAGTKGYDLTTSAYNPLIYGVITHFPAVAFENQQGEQNSFFAVRQGKTYTLVSSINGDIKINDPITSSSMPGVGEKADRNGFILGAALESYSNTNPKAIGKILIAVDPHFDSSRPDIKTNLIELFREAGVAAFLSPLSALRYLLAGIMIIGSFVLGFIYVGRIAAKGIEAIGRNPLAGRTIQLSVALNISLTIAVICIGIGIAYLILIL